MNKRSALTFIFSSAMVLGVGTAAGAQDDTGCSASPQTCETPQVLSDPLPTSSAPTVDTPAVAAAPLPAQTLPVTGSETAALAIGGTLLVAAGGALVWRSNRAAA